MASYLIYLPEERNGTKPGLVESWGLSDISDFTPTSTEVLENGPDEGYGVCLSWDDLKHPERNPRAFVHLESQTWRKAPGKNYWIGWETARPPRPIDLMRTAIHAGGDVTLEDGNAWHIPIARQLPCVLELDDNGKLNSVPKAAYRKFYEGAQKWEEWIIAITDQQQGTFPYREAFDFSCLALSMNYRLNPEVISTLGLLSTSNIAAIGAACIELNARLMVVEQKKSA